jgi:hypothetical protein
VRPRGAGKASSRHLRHLAVNGRLIGKIDGRLVGARQQRVSKVGSLVEKVEKPLK